MKLDRILMALATAGVSLALSEPATRGIVPEEVVQARPQPKAAGANDDSTAYFRRPNRPMPSSPKPASKLSSKP